MNRLESENGSRPRMFPSPAMVRDRVDEQANTPIRDALDASLSGRQALERRLSDDKTFAAMHYRDQVRAQMLYEWLLDYHLTSVGCHEKEIEQLRERAFNADAEAAGNLELARARSSEAQRDRDLLAICEKHLRANADALAVAEGRVDKETALRHAAINAVNDLRQLCFEMIAELPLHGPRRSRHRTRLDSILTPTPQPNPQS